MNIKLILIGICCMLVLAGCKEKIYFPLQQVSIQNIPFIPLPDCGYNKDSHIGGLDGNEPDAIRWAARDGDFDAVVCLVNKYKPTGVLSGDWQFNLAVNWAGGENGTKIQKFLIENGADICGDSYGGCPLPDQAMNQNNSDFIIFLMENGLDLHYNNDRIIKWAILNNQSSLLRYITSKGMNLEGYNASFPTPFNEILPIKLINCKHNEMMVLLSDKFYSEASYSFVCDNYYQIPCGVNCCEHRYYRCIT